MADRRAQLEEAFKESMEDETEETGENLDGSSDDEAKEDSSGAVDDNEPVLGSSEEDAAPTEPSGKEKTEKVAGKDSKGVVDKAAKKPAARADSGKPVGDKPAGKTLEQTEKEVAEAGDPPKAWKVAAREHWAKVPKEAREEITRREAEITQFIGRHGGAIQHKQQFDEVVQPYLPFIAAQQSTPLKAFQNLMNTAARLTTGAPEQKARVIAEIMRNYGVDVRTLDGVLTSQLSGAGPSPAHQDQQPPAWAQPLFNFMTQAERDRQAREQRTRDEAAAELAEFEKKPYFDVLQEDIGLIMTRAASKGQLITMAQAYEKARKMNPEVDKILTQREQAAAGNGGDHSALMRARVASSSVKGSPVSGAAVPNGAAKKDPPKDRRAALEDAFAQIKDG